MVVAIGNYAYLVPYVENGEELYLKTLIPSRKATQKYTGSRIMKTKLSKEEKEILASFEKGEWVPVPIPAKEKRN